MKNKEYNYPPHFRVKLQNGAMKEVGENGCHLQDVVKIVKTMVDEYDKELPCEENKKASLLLDLAYEQLCLRKLNRIQDGNIGRSTNVKDYGFGLAGDL